MAAANETPAQLHGEFDRIAYPVSPDQRFVPDGVSEGAMLVQMFLDKQVDDKKLAADKITADGQYGKDSKALVAKYQTAHHLNATGYVNDSTFAAMKNDGFDVDKAIQDEHAYQNSPEGKKYKEANSDIVASEAIASREFAYMTGSTAKNSALTVGSQGVAVAAVQNQINEDYKRVYGDKPPAGYKPLPVTGKFDEATREALTAWQKDDKLHSPTSDTDNSPIKVPATSYGKVDRATYDAFFWKPTEDGKKPADYNYAQNGLDVAQFGVDLQNPGSAVAKELGPDKVKSIEKSETMEQARRSHSEHMAQHVKALQEHHGAVAPTASPAAAVGNAQGVSR